MKNAKQQACHKERRALRPQAITIGGLLGSVQQSAYGPRKECAPGSAPGKSFVGSGMDTWPSPQIQRGMETAASWYERPAGPHVNLICPVMDPAG